MNNQPSPLGISLSELSRRLGRSRAALRKLAKAGTIPCNPDGTYDEAAVRYAYGRNTHPSWRKPLKGALGDVAQPISRLPVSADVPIDPGTLIRRVLAEEGRQVVGAIDHDDIRTGEVILRCRKIAHDIAKTEREFIPVAPVQRHVEAAFRALCDSAGGIPAIYGPQMSAEVGCDRARLQEALSVVIGDVLAGVSSPIWRLTPSREA